VALAEAAAGMVGRSRWIDAALALAARHTALLELLLLGALAVGGRGPAGHRRRHAALRTLGALALSVLAVEVLGRSVRRARPFAGALTTPLVPHSPLRSFPSRHAACAASMATVASSAAPTIGRLMAALGAVLGVSRACTRLHYPSDILAGWLVGVAAGQVAVRSGRPGYTSRGRKWGRAGRCRES
jgi:membrane-associated phospholipid phosphatase